MPGLLSTLRHPLRAANQRIERYVLRHVKRRPGPISVPRQRIYILPTRLGIVFAAMLLLMLLGAMNYSNSLAFALCFLLAGLGLVCMHHTNRNLVNLNLSAGRAEPVFVGEVVAFPVHIGNPGNGWRMGLQLGLSQRDALPGVADAEPGGSATLWIRQPAERRGLSSAPRFSLFSEFPLGLFHAWTWAHVANDAIVYPKPAGQSLSPPRADGEGHTTTTLRRGDDDFAGVREYQRGDAMSAVHWRAAARTGQLVVKQFSATRNDDLIFDFDALSGLDTEQRLSQMTRWVLDASRQGRGWGMVLPGLTLPMSSGPRHLTLCLRSLALYGLDDPTVRSMQARAA